MATVKPAVTPAKPKKKKRIVLIIIAILGLLVVLDFINFEMHGGSAGHLSGSDASKKIYQKFFPSSLTIIDTQTLEGNFFTAGSNYTVQLSNATSADLAVKLQPFIDSKELVKEPDGKTADGKVVSFNGYYHEGNPYSLKNVTGYVICINDGGTKAGATVTVQVGDDGYRTQGGILKNPDYWTCNSTNSPAN